MIVYCYNKKCKNRSKKPSKTLNKKGEAMHKCLCKHITINPYVADEYDFEKNAVSCLSFISKEEGADADAN